MSNPGRTLLLSKVTERQFQTQVESWAKRSGWRIFHSWSSLHSPAGFPDLCMVRGRRLVFAELKRMGKRPDGYQNAWHDDLRLVPGVEVYVWTPDMEDEVRRVLGDRP